MKKFLSITLVLVLLAGVAAFAADERPLSGTWSNTVTLDPQSSGRTFADFDSTLDIEYVGGGATWTSKSVFGLEGFTDQEFGADFSVGLLDVTTKLNLEPAGADLDYWKNSGSLTLGGVSIDIMHLLQRMDWDPVDPGYEADFWPEYTEDYFPTIPTFVQTPSVDATQYGSGVQIGFSGETPGGISVTVTSDFGMMPVADAERELKYDAEDVIEADMVDFASTSGSGASEFSEVTGEDAMDWLEDLFSLASPSSDNIDVDGDDSPDKAYNEELLAYLANELAVGDADGSGEASPGVSQLAVDFAAWVDKQFAEAPDDVLNNEDSAISDTVRDALVADLTAQIVIAGVAGETGSVVTTDFGVDGLLVDWVNPGSADPKPVVDVVETVPGKYGPSSLEYYSTKLEFEGLSIGCCDFSNETYFSEPYGFEYTEFGFEMTENNIPIDVSATLKFDFSPGATDTGKQVTLTPDFSTDWGCFQVWTELDWSQPSIDGLTVKGFELSADLGHVTVTSVTALGDYYVSDLVSRYHQYDEVLTIEKLSEFPLDFTLDLYTNMGSGLAPEAVEGVAEYPLSDQFSLGTGFALTNGGGLEELKLMFDYSF